MDQEYMKTFSELNEILKLMPLELTNKIPKSFCRMIEEKRDKNYNPNIQEPIEKQSLRDETKIILGLIYRDFLCSPEEKTFLQQEDSKELAKIEQEIEREKIEKYNPKNIFKKNIEQENVSNAINQEEFSLVKHKGSFFRRIINKIKNFFHRS